MSAARTVAVVSGVLIFVVAKVYFLLKTPKSLALATIPAIILILSSPTTTSAKDIR